MSKKNDQTTSLLEDVDFVATWAEDRNAQIDNNEIIVRENDMPILAKVICGGEDAIRVLDTDDQKKYTAYFKKNKRYSENLTLTGPMIKAGITGVSISAIASGIGIGSSIAGIGIAGIGGATSLITASGLGIAGVAGMAVPAFWPIGISLLAFNAGIIFKKFKNNKSKKERATKLEVIFSSSQKESQKCNKKIIENNKKIQKLLTTKLKNTLSSLSETSKKVAINVDDLVHSDQNLRIMQYQEIVLQQYNSQNEIRQMLSELFDAYNKLKVENDDLTKKIAAYEANMRILACANNYLN